MIAWSRELAGRLEELEIESEALRGNPLGDPHVRPLWVYVPPGYDEEPEHRFPSVFVIQGFTGQLDMWRNREPLRLGGRRRGASAALVPPMLRPALFAGVACHCGDSLFETCYTPDFPKAVRALRDDYDGASGRFWDDGPPRPTGTKSSDNDLLETWGYAACYSADADGTVRLPS